MAWDFLLNIFRRKHADQGAYQKAAAEMRSGFVREGLMLKAAAHSDGDPTKSRALYLKFLAEQIAEEEASDRFRDAVAQARVRTQSNAAIAYGAVNKASAPAVKAVSEWGAAFISNMIAWLVISFLTAVFLTQHSLDNHEELWDFLFSNWGSAYFWGLALAPTIVIFLIVGVFLAVLLCFPFMRRHNGIASLIALFPVAFFVITQWQGQEALKRYQIASSPKVAVGNPQKIAPHADNSYARALSMYEQRYPVINPDSPAFNEALTNRIWERMQQHVKAGNSQDVALGLAISEMLGATP